MTAKPGQQTTAIHLLSNISQSKGNQTIKFAQLINITREIFFFQKSCKNDAGRLLPDLFLIFVKALYEVKASGLHLRFNIFR